MAIDDERCKEYRDQTALLIAEKEKRIASEIAHVTTMVQAELKNIVAALEEVDEESIKKIVAGEMAKVQHRDLTKGVVSIPVVLTLIVYVFVVAGTWFAAKSERDQLRRDCDRIERTIHQHVEATKK